MRSIAVAIVALSGCSKPEAASVADFVGKPGVLEKACVVERDGKRFVVEGRLEAAGGKIEREGDDVEFRLAAPSGEPSLPIVVELGDLLTLKEANMKRDWRVGPGGTSGDVKSLALHTKSGDAALGERLKVTFKVSVLQHFQSKAVTGCTYRVTALERP